MAHYVLCPRCELNYILDGQGYCDVCKAELKIGPQMMFSVEDDELKEQMLCPVCKQRYINDDEEMCSVCREEMEFNKEKSEQDVDFDKDEEWRNYLDDDEIDMPQEDEISFSQLADEEKGDELFREDEEDEVAEPIDDEPDDFDIEIDEKDFEEDDEDEEDDDDDDDDGDDF